MLLPLPQRGAWVNVGLTLVVERRPTGEVLGTVSRAGRGGLPRVPATTLEGFIEVAV